MRLTIVAGKREMQDSKKNEVPKETILRGPIYY
jgi:hypothetical protein